MLGVDPKKVKNQQLLKELIFYGTIVA